MKEVIHIDVLVGCEESQAVTIELRKMGIKAFSCDLQECSGGHPEWHIQMDIFEVIKQHPEIRMLICFPPCDFLTVSANKWYKDQPARKSGKLVGAARREARGKALRFVCDLMNLDIEHMAFENPIGVIGSRIFWYCGGMGKDRWEVFPTETIGGRKPDQIIQPWMFGHGETKATCLWLKNLPKLNWVKEDNLFETKTAVEGREQKIWKASPSKERSKLRSKTFPGIAKSMANTWGGYLINSK